MPPNPALTHQAFPSDDLRLLAVDDQLLLDEIVPKGRIAPDEHAPLPHRAEFVPQPVRGDAGFPMIDDLLAVLYAHPQVHVEVGGIVWSQPRENFYRYLRQIVDAGFVDRVMFGSDQMVWPGVIERSIRVVEEAPFLSEQQKRDILYNNAARFLRLTPAQIAEHHGR